MYCTVEAFYFDSLGKSESRLQDQYRQPQDLSLGAALTGVKETSLKDRDDAGGDRGDAGGDSMGNTFGACTCLSV